MVLLSFILILSTCFITVIINLSIQKFLTGKIEKVEVRVKPEHCDGSCGDGTCGQREVEHSSMYAAAKNLADLDYVLCSQLGPQAIQSLARFNVRAFDIALPIADAIAKINLYRNKIAERALKIKNNIASA